LPVSYIKGEKLVKKGAKSGKKVVKGQKNGGEENDKKGLKSGKISVKEKVEMI
jgi:hypothetical protein